jgi:hypothetical protein
MRCFTLLNGPSAGGLCVDVQLESKRLSLAKVITKQCTACLVLPLQLLYC